MTAEIRSRVLGLGFELVDLRKRGSGRRVSLQVRIDRPDSAPGRGVTAGDCAVVSRALQRWLDSASTLGPRYILEVSSPGIERPIRWREHWERFAGREVRVRLPGRGRIRATIVRLADAQSVVLRPADAGGEITVPLDQAEDATLVVNWSEVDRLLSKSTGKESS